MHLYNLKSKEYTDPHAWNNLVTPLETNKQYHFDTFKLNKAVSTRV